MLVAMSVGATEEELEHVRAFIRSEGLTPHESHGMERVVIGVVGDVGARKERVMNKLSALPGVASVTPISRPFKLASREFHPDGHDRPRGRCGRRRRVADGHGRARAPWRAASS